MPMLTTDSHTTDLEDISRKVFSAHFGQRCNLYLAQWNVFPRSTFSNYEAWLSDPTHIKPSAQVVWPIVGQEILNGDVGGGFKGTNYFKFLQLWRGSGITSELQLCSGALSWQDLCSFLDGGTTSCTKQWFQNVESMMNHHLAELLGLGSLSWSGHQIHIALPVNTILDAGGPKEIPLPTWF